MIVEPFRTLYVDPGEDTGWCQSVGNRLIGGGTIKMHEFSQESYDGIMDSIGERTVWNADPILNDTSKPWFEGECNDALLPIGRLVVEDFRIYPWEARNLAWDQVRTARLIGKLELIAELGGAEFVLQGANIKPRAVAGGAEEFYRHPLHENRHQNDAIQHFFFYTQTTMVGNPRLDILDAHKITAHHPV